MRAPILTTLLFVLATAPLPVPGHRPGLDSGLPAARLLSKEPTKGASKYTPIDISFTGAFRERKWKVQKDWNEKLASCVQTLQMWGTFSHYAYLEENLDADHPKIDNLRIDPQENGKYPFCSFTMTFKKGISCEFSTFPDYGVLGTFLGWSGTDMKCLPYTTLKVNRTPEMKERFYYEYILHNMGGDSCRPQAYAKITRFIKELNAVGFLNPEISLEPQNILGIKLSFGAIFRQRMVVKLDNEVCKILSRPSSTGATEYLIKNLSTGWRNPTAEADDGSPKDPCQKLRSPSFSLDPNLNAQTSVGVLYREFLQEINPFIKSLKEDKFMTNPKFEFTPKSISSLFETCFPKHSTYEIVVSTVAGTCPLAIMEDEDKKLVVTRATESSGCELVIKPERFDAVFSMPR